MNGRIRDLSNVIRLNKETGSPFVLMLGAGASLSSGVPTTYKIMEELLAKYDSADADGAGVEDRFNRLWARTADPMRGKFLAPYLTHRPSVGYQLLAELIAAGFFDVVLTFNFDQLLETALRDAGLVDFKTIIRGETSSGEIERLIDAPEPRVKIVKLHGSLKSSDHFLFDASEMLAYPPEIEGVVKRITHNDILVTGYAFNDVCVIRAFNTEGNTIYCVNPSGFPRSLSAFLKKRRSENNDIRLDFDSFFKELHAELLRPDAAPEARKTPPNPFKFLESYDRADAPSFRGRDMEIKRFAKYLELQPPRRLIVIVGAAKSGKTSLVRAGLIPSLDPARQVAIFVRCRANITNHLANELARLGQVPEGLDLQAAFAHLSKAANGRLVILFLDQFERLLEHLELRTAEGKQALSDIVGSIIPPSDTNILVVPIISDETNLGGKVSEEAGMHVQTGTLTCEPFQRKEIAEIMQAIATAGGFDFHPKIIEELAEEVETSGSSARPEKRFTLAHVHAICHILAGAQSVTYEEYRRAFDVQNRDALHDAINVSEFMGFVEDRGWPSSVWFRNMLKVPLRESKERIANFIKAHYEELLPGLAPTDDFAAVPVAERRDAP